MFCLNETEDNHNEQADCEFPEEEKEETKGNESNTEDSDSEYLTEESASSEENENAPQQQGQEETRYPVRMRRAKQFPDYKLYQAVCDEDEPTTVEEAMAGPDKEKWKQAMFEEYNSFQKNNAWTLVDLPEDKKAVQNKWIFKKKKD